MEELDAMPLGENVRSLRSAGGVIGWLVAVD